MFLSVEVLFQCVNKFHCRQSTLNNLISTKSKLLDVYVRCHSTPESPASLPSPSPTHPEPPHPPTGNAHQELRAIRELCSRRVFPALSGPIRGTDSREIHHVGRSHAASSSLSLINHGTPTHNQIGSLCLAGEWPEELADDHMTPRTNTHAHTLRLPKKHVPARSHSYIHSPHGWFRPHKYSRMGW